MSSSTFNEVELVNELRRGERKAFAALYEHYKDSVFNYCASLVKNNEAAEDVVHDVFLSIWTKKHTLVHARSFRSWVFSIARNRALESLRDRRHAEGLSEDLSLEEDSPLELVLNRERSMMVDGLLDHLRPAYRELILLRIEGECSYAEIADITGRSQAAIRTHLFRARKALAKVYAELYGGDHGRSV